LNEEEIIKKAQDGDINAFEILVENHKNNIYKIAFSMVQNHHDATDIAQIALIKVYENLSKFTFKSSFSTWLYRITVNSCLDEIRKRKKASDLNITINDEENPFEIEADTLTPEESYEKKELKKLVWENIQKLSDKYKRVIILRDINGLSYTEIAKIERCSEGTVKSRINRARISLKELILKDGTFSL
jgi:RNA polymerase sigma-70 factor (ECF subfamily)